MFQQAEKRSNTNQWLDLTLIRRYVHLSDQLLTRCRNRYSIMSFSLGPIYWTTKLPITSQAPNPLSCVTPPHFAPQATSSRSQKLSASCIEWRLEITSVEDCLPTKNVDGLDKRKAWRSCCVAFGTARLSEPSGTKAVCKHDEEREQSCKREAWLLMIPNSHLGWRVEIAVTERFEPRVVMVVGLGYAIITAFVLQDWSAVTETVSDHPDLISTALGHVESCHIGRPHHTTE